MATNANVNKVIYGGNIIIDLTADTVEAQYLKQGITAHAKSGETITGTNTYDADTSDATAAASEILDTKTAYVQGAKVTGAMPNRGQVEEKITTKAQSVTIQQGYHDGSGNVEIDATEQNKIIGGNIKDGVEILGVLGTYTGEGVTSQSKTVTPDKDGFTVLPDDVPVHYDFLSQVVINPIPYVETDNASGGKTVTIA